MNITLRWRVAQYFEQRWWQSYLAGKDPKEYIIWKRNYWTDVLTQLTTIEPEVTVPLIEGGLNILDAGCGPAGVFLILNEHRVTAIDPLWDSYKAKFGYLGYNEMKHAQFSNLPIEALEIKEEMDMVCSMNALNHVSDLRLAIQKLLDALKPGGWLVITMDTHNFGLLKWLFKSIPGDILHPHQNDLEGYQKLIESLGATFIGSDLIKHGNVFDHHLMVFRKD